MYDGKANPKEKTVKMTLIVDDHPLYCDAMCSSLLTAFKVQQVKAANSLTEATRLLSGGLVPDLVLLDIGLPDTTGLSGFLKLKELLPDVPILVISADSSDETIQASMDAGAAGFIPKDAPRHVIADALAEVQDGEKFLPPGFWPQPRARAQDAASPEDISQRLAALTPQQSRIINLICAGKPNKVIAYELSVTEGTVKAHITALLRRLGVSNRTQAAILANSANLDRGRTEFSDMDARALLN
ncbi:response regulator [Yoonia sediminilitoris]|uniref:LuxR family two component transcriptional regulator n=1 Tax=Yoonia sediminilitoris TaxID=1286148 RepID=A0A2T6KSA4_9RHOB|nr:response regulator transcription factor [Yoonia sediminilitoris]PUB19432.1 LuxR family two component transcriptional regulator [Yoonia sediminilitoris]RCW99600.1 LuxR family two component transcriptional regulator [Yoonia sediminilitoris]